MALIHWQPWQEITTLRQQMDQLFDEIGPATSQLPTEAAYRGHWVPAVELKTTATDVIVRAELPGIAGKDLDVQVTREAVSLAGEYKSESTSDTGRMLRSEFRYGRFQRVIPLPVAVRNDQVVADFQNGILTLTLPKVQAERPKVVKVTLGEAIATSALPETNGQAPTVSTAQIPVEQPAGGASPKAAPQVEMGDLWAEPTH